MRTFAFRTLLCFVALGLAIPASAEEFCATNSAELASSLFYAATNGQDDVIRVHIGTYGGASLHVFRYTPALFPDGDVGKSLTVVGGYTEFFGYPCGRILVEDPKLTVLHGGGTDRALELYVNDNSDVTIRLLYFFHGTPGVDPWYLGGGLSYRYDGTDGGSVTIERNIFRYNQADTGAGLSIYNAHGLVRVINNVFTINDGAQCAAAYVRANPGQGLFSGMYIANNTVISNTDSDSDSDSGGGLCLSAIDVALFVYNNNLWNNERNDLYVSRASGFTLRSNNIGVRGGDAPTESSGNISVQPQFERGPLNFTPVRNSPLVDAGIRPPPGVQPWYLTDYDLRAQTRVVGSRVDIGAYENERIFRNGFESSHGGGPGLALTAELPCESSACDGTY